MCNVMIVMQYIVSFVLKQCWGKFFILVLYLAL